MPTPRTLSFHEYDSLGNPVENAVISIVLSGDDLMSDGIHAPLPQRIKTDASGNASIDLIPSVDGNQGRTYNVKIAAPGTGIITTDRDIEMPDENKAFHLIPTATLPIARTTTLAGYDITDAYTSTVIDDLLAAKAAIAVDEVISGDWTFSGSTLLAGTEIQQDGDFTGLLIDQNGNGKALSIDSESTTSPAIEIESGTITTANVFRVDNADALTTGKILNLVSNSADTSTRQLIKLTNNNPLATGTTTLRIQQNAAQNGVYLDQNGNGIALEIDSEATTANVIGISTTVTTGNVIGIGNVDDLTTGKILNLVSNSADTSTRDLVRIHNDNQLATGTTPLWVRNDGVSGNAARIVSTSTSNGLLLDQNANSTSLTIDSEATSAPIFHIDTPITTAGSIIKIDEANSLTTGAILNLVSASNSADIRNLVYVKNDHVSATGTTVMKLKQDSSGDALYIDTRHADSTAIEVYSQATTGNAIDVTTILATSGSVLNISEANSLTTGNILDLESDSADTSTRSLIDVRNSNSLAVNAIPLTVHQDAAGKALNIDQNGDGIALSIDAESTTADVIDITSPLTTTGLVIDVNSADSLTTGSVARLQSNSADTSERSVVKVINNNSLATGTTTLEVRQEAAAIGMFIDQNGNAPALKIESLSTSSNTFSISDPQTTIGNILNISDADALTTGRIAYFRSNSVDTSIRDLVKITNDNPLATGTTPLTIRQDADKRALFIDMNGNSASLSIDSEATTNHTITIEADTLTTGSTFRVDNADSLTTGRIALMQSNSADTSTRDLMLIINDNPLATGTTPLNIRQDSDQRAMLVDQNGNGTSIDVDTDSTSGSGIYVTANNLSGGRCATFYSNSGDGSTRNLVRIHNDNGGASNTTALKVIQDANESAVEINANHSSGGNALKIFADAPQSSVIFIDTPETTSASAGMYVIDANSLTTGGIARFHSNSADTSTRELVSIHNDNSLAGNTTAMMITQDASAIGLEINQNGGHNALRLDANNTGANVIDIINPLTTTAFVIDCNNANALTTGSVLNLVSDSADASARSLALIHNDNSLAVTATCLELEQDSSREAMQIKKGTTDGGFIDFRANGDADTTSAISTLTTSGAVTHHIQIEINGSKAWIPVSTNAPS